MRNRTRLGLAAFLGATALIAACGDDGNPAMPPPVGGSSGGGAGGATAGATAAGTGGATAGTAGTAGAGGTAGTGGGGTAGTAGGGTAGTGGTPQPIDPTVFLIDNIRLQPKSAAGGAGGAGGADSGGAGGADSGGAGGTPDTGGGAGGVPAAGGAAAGSGNEGGAPATTPPDFLMTFDNGVTPLAIHGDGFSPGPGGSLGPVILPNTTFVHEADTGNPGGAAKVSVPFSVPSQQADIAAGFIVPQDLTGYELTADVKLLTTGTIGDCPTVWMYVWGGGYANDFDAEPALGETNHLVEGEWVTVRLDLDGPYGYHSTTYHPDFEPTAITVWGMHFNTWGCE